MIYNYTKCESVIAKIMADLDSSDIDNRISDIREWIFEAVDKIGAPMLYISKESGVDGLPILKIEDNQVPLPIDLVVLDGVAYSENENGPWVPMNSSSALFKGKTVPNKKKVIHTAPPHDPANKAIEDYAFIMEDQPPIGHKQITSQSLLYTRNGMKYAEKVARHYNERPEYFIKPGWIVTNKKRGYIKLAYKAIAVDERGYPLIPDLGSYLEAIYWYVTMKLCFPKFMTGKLGGRGVNNASNVYFYTQQLWNFYRNQAYAEAMMPTADVMNNIKNDWNKLVPEWDARDNFFEDINKEQSIYTDYYYGY